MTDVGLRVRELVRHTCEQLETEILRGVVSKEMIQEYLAHHFERKGDDNFDVE